MPYCPECGFEYRPGHTHCPDCSVALRPGAPPEASAPPNIRLTRLSIFADPSEAEIVRAALAEADIPCLLRKHGPITGELGSVTDGITEDYAILLVPEDRFDEASRLLARVQSAPFEWPEGMEPDDEDEDL